MNDFYNSEFGIRNFNPGSAIEVSGGSFRIQNSRRSRAVPRRGIFAAFGLSIV